VTNLFAAPFCFFVALQNLQWFLEKGLSRDAWLGVVGILMAGINLGIAIGRLEERPRG